MKHLLRGLFIAVLLYAAISSSYLHNPCKNCLWTRTSASVNWTTGLPITFDTMHFLKNE